MELPDWNAAHVFVEIVRHGSLTGAARQLGLPKSTVSRKLSELEARLGAKLVQRTTRALSLTDVGAAYFQRASRAAQDLAEAEQVVVDSQEQPRGVLRITAPGDMGPLLTSIVTEFLDAHPHVNVFVDLSNRYVDLIAEGYDLALRAGKLEDSTYIARPVFQTSLELYASPDYLDRAGRPERMDELASHRCLVFGAEDKAAWVLSRGDEVVRVQVQGRFLAKDFATLRRGALLGFGVTLLPNFVAGPDVHLGRLERVLAPFAAKSAGLHLVYPSRELLPAKTRSFIAHLEQSLAQWEGRCDQARAPAATSRALHETCAALSE